MTVKLDNGQRHLMRLVLKDKNAEGWTKVSAVVWPLMASLPSDLVESKLNDDGNGGLARLTDNGEAVLLYT